MSQFGYTNPGIAIEQRLRLFLAGRGFDPDYDDGELTSCAGDAICDMLSMNCLDPDVEQGSDQREALPALIAIEASEMLFLTECDCPACNYLDMDAFLRDWFICGGDETDRDEAIERWQHAAEVHADESEIPARVALGRMLAENIDQDALLLLGEMIVSDLDSAACPLGALYLDALDPTDESFNDGLAFNALRRYISQHGIPADLSFLIQEIAEVCTPFDDESVNLILERADLNAQMEERAFAAAQSGEELIDLTALLATPLYERLTARVDELF
jgi:hypothetical protein